ncbi:S-layer homology domain-containing protein, partial [Thermoleptolyngbya sp.]
PTPAPTPTPTPAPVTFTDISRDIYATQIRNAVAAGFISGFPDNTFRPLDTLTREQLVSMVLDALTKAPNVNLRIPAVASGDPYRDVNASRWSAAKIQFARDNNIVRGYEDGTFRPAQPVTRAELVSVLKRAAEFALTARGSSPTLLLNQPTRTFADTTNHWASATITELSGFCGVASPLNEQGNNFAPNAASQRNYAAAATLRTLDCLQLPQ